MTSWADLAWRPDQRARNETPRLEIVLLFILFAWFLWQAIFYANHFALGTSPDAPFHVEVSKLFSTSLFSFSIHDTSATTHLGPVSRMPLFYHILLGKILWVKDALGVATDPEHFLRGVSIAISAIGFFCSWGLLRATGLAWQGRLLVMHFLVATAMWTFMSAMVNYDCLVFALTAICVWGLASLVRRFSGGALFCVLAAGMLGTATKIVFLPIITITFPLAIWFSRQSLQSKAFWKGVTRNPVAIAAVLTLLVLFRSNWMIFGVNLIKYQHLLPSCDQIHPLQECIDEYPIMRRDVTIKEQFARQPRMPLQGYLDYYHKAVDEDLFGISAHKFISPTLGDRATTRMAMRVWGLALIAAILTRRGRRLFRDPMWWTLLAVAVFYSGTVIAENYSVYRDMGLIRLGLQGRYLLPTWVLLLYALHAPLFVWERPRLTNAIALLLAILYSFQGFPVIMAEHHRAEREEIISP